MVQPPKKSDAVYKSFTEEAQAIYDSQKRRAVKLQQTLNSMENVTCNPAEGAMYLFPQIRFSKKALDAAKAAGKEPDTFYALRLLEETGVVCTLGRFFFLWLSNA